MKKERNYWPLGIVAILVGVIFLIIWTINFAVKAKVQDETTFFLDYRDVDLGINELQIAQVEFEKRYEFTPMTKKFELGENTLRFRIQDKEGQGVTQAGTKILLTRPHTNEQNQDLVLASLADGIFTTNVFKVEGKGRWKVQYYIEIGKDKAFYSQEINTTM